MDSFYYVLLFLILIIYFILKLSYIYTNYIHDIQPLVTCVSAKNCNIDEIQYLHGHLVLTHPDLAYFNVLILSVVVILFHGVRFHRHLNIILFMSYLCNDMDEGSVEFISIFISIHFYRFESLKFSVL